jgi:ribosomal protein S18 acetylase RimI-like enzyme
MTREDIPAGLRLCRAAGWNQREADWRAMLDLNPDGFVAAVSEGAVVGTGGSVRYGGSLAWVCMILVDPAARGQGIGTRIMEELLEKLKGVPAVGLDATPRGRPVYLKLGFRDARPLARFEARPASPFVRAAAIRPLTPADLPAVLAWDREAFGADRGAVLRWALDEAPEYAWCAEGAGLRGYCFGRHGHNAEHLGPVVARDRSTARDLVAAGLASASARAVFIDASREPAEWGSALGELGFVEQRPFTRMYRGDAAEPGRPQELFAVVGPEFG